MKKVIDELPVQGLSIMPMGRIYFSLPHYELPKIHFCGRLHSAVQKKSKAVIVSNLHNHAVVEEPTV
jgi:hypothetical protein